MIETAARLPDAYDRASRGDIASRVALDEKQVRAFSDGDEAPVTQAESLGGWFRSGCVRLVPERVSDTSGACVCGAGAWHECRRCNRTQGESP